MKRYKLGQDELQSTYFRVYYCSIIYIRKRLLTV